MNKTLITAIGVVAYIVSPDVLADGYRMGEWNGHMWGSGMIFGPLMMLGFFALFVFGLVMFIRWIVRLVLPSQIPTNTSALEILNERFAKGEIEKEEYEERKNVLLS
jgi:putative membrane protein